MQVTINFCTMKLFIPIIYFSFLLGCLLCYSLHYFFSVPIVLAASLPALLATFVSIPDKFKHHPYAALYAGCFAGMCSIEVISSFTSLFLISLVGGALYQLSIGLFDGFGGRLGGIAFTSVALFSLLDFGIL